jgi:hypothetical protein
VKTCLRLLVAACIVVGIGGGCASPQMKGTPFYTGEYSVRQGPAEDRVNLWPLLYYRQPALSVLWPFGELTEDHLAIRPLMSIYNRDRENPVYNVLWPLARFDTEQHEHRIFPFFWGQDYRIGFPFYWHFNEPWGEGGYDGLLPFWSYRSRGKGRYSTHVMWPFIHAKRWTDAEKGWRVWPLAGSYLKHGKRYRYAAWPLGHQWSRTDGTRSGSCLVPLYYQASDDDRDDSLFVSLPYSRRVRSDRSWETVLPLYHRRSTADRRAFYSLLYSGGSDSAYDEKWNLIMPLWYWKSRKDERTLATLAGGFRRSDAGTSWMALPLLSGGQVSENCGDVWLGGPLAHVGWDGEYGSHHVFPLYYRSRSETGKRFYSLLWSSGEDNKTESDWQLLLPLMYRHSDADRKTLVTPLYAQGSADAGKTKWKCLIPLVLNRRTQEEHLVATLLGGYHKTADKTTWLAYPFLTGGHVSEEAGSFWAAAPLFHARWNDEGSTHQLLPLYYWNGWNDTFASLPLARWKHGEDATTTMVPPALSWLTHRDKRSDLWMLGPLAHVSWGEAATSSHVFPLYYHGRQSGAFASPLVARWKHGEDATTTMIPPTLSWLTHREECSDLWMLGPLAHLSWGEEATSSHVFPLYYHNRESGAFSSLLWANWEASGMDFRLVPPLLSLYTREHETRNVYGALGLFRQQWGGDRKHAGHLVPLYAYREHDYFLSPLFGWNHDRDGFLYPLTPLVGLRRGDYSGGWLFPLWSRKEHRVTGDSSGTLLWGTYWRRGARSASTIWPIYGYEKFGELSPERDSDRPGLGRYGKRFWSLPACWYRNETRISRNHGLSKDSIPLLEQQTRKHGFFPFWHYANSERVNLKRKDISGSVLLLLYDYKREVRGDRDNKEGSGKDYTRARVLWRLWHYERVNGDVSVDVFPAITYDKKADGFKKLSFLWRLFRYEKGPKGKKLDLLFVPIVRKQADE